MVNETVDRVSLETLAKEIAQCATDAEEHTIRAVLLVREARERVDAGEAGDTKWYEWAPKNIELSASRLRELQSIAEAKDPKAELKRLRELNNARQARHRESKKTPPSPNGGAAPDPVEIKRTAASPNGGTTTDPAQKKTAAPLRNGGTAIEVSAESKDDREVLIEWARSAQPDQIAAVLTYIRRFDSADAVANPEQAAEPAVT